MKQKKAKPIVFKLHGQPFDPTGSAEVFAKMGMIQGTLNKTEDGDVLDCAELSSKCGLTGRSLSDYNQKLREGGYAVKIGAKNFYGNKDNIAGLKLTIEA